MMMKSRALLLSLCALTLSAGLLGASSVIIARSALARPQKNLAGRQIRTRRAVRSIPTTAVVTLPPATMFAETRPSTTVLGRAPGRPTRLDIPSIGLDAQIVSVGLKPDGSLRVPSAADAGWYHFGATPGDEIGSAVIAGHVDHEGQPGVFINLTQLAIGADVLVTDQTGETRRFTVTERFQVAKGDLPTEELFRTVGPATLTLITCGGEFDSNIRRYTDNIVIRATPTSYTGT
jgi:LPXTG-site transpeptidase (sortase) family protein